MIDKLKEIEAAGLYGLTLENYTWITKEVKRLRKLVPKDDRNMKRWRAFFDSVWAEYPEKKGKHAAWLHFKAQVKTTKDLIDISAALENYKTDMERVREQHPERPWLHGSTWFNHRWEDFIDYTAPAEGKKKSTFQVKRDTVDTWAEKRGENGGKSISVGAQNFPELRGSKP